MGNFLSSLKSSASKRGNGSADIDGSANNCTSNEYNPFEKRSVSGSSTTASSSPSPTTQQTELESTTIVSRLFSKHKSASNKTKKSINLPKLLKMSVILQPTVKQTASVIFLHGLGDTGHGWSSVFGFIKRPHIKYIFPTAPVRPITLNGGIPMNAWFDIKSLRPDAAQDEEGIKDSAQILMSLVQEELKNGIPSERIIIGGFSQGGATALYTALTSSMRFGGVLALSTWLPLHNRFPELLKPCEGLMATPIFQAHGDVDPMVSLAWSQLSAKFLQQIGFTDLRFKVYPGLSHSSSEDEMDDVSDFINRIVPN